MEQKRISLLLVLFLDLNQFESKLSLLVVNIAESLPKMENYSLGAMVMAGD
jgi:hypothetical protein